MTYNIIPEHIRFLEISCNVWNTAGGVILEEERPGLEAWGSCKRNSGEFFCPSSSGSSLKDTWALYQAAIF